MLLSIRFLHVVGAIPIVPVGLIERQPAAVAQGDAKQVLASGAVQVEHRVLGRVVWLAATYKRAVGVVCQGAWEGVFYLNRESV